MNSFSGLTPALSNGFLKICQGNAPLWGHFLNSCLETHPLQIMVLAEQASLLITRPSILKKDIPAGDPGFAVLSKLSLALFSQDQDVLYMHCVIVRPSLFILLPCFPCSHFGSFNHRQFLCCRLSQSSLLFLPHRQLIQPPISIAGPLVKGQNINTRDFWLSCHRAACDSGKPGITLKKEHRVQVEGKVLHLRGFSETKGKARGSEDIWRV